MVCIIVHILQLFVSGMLSKVTFSIRTIQRECHSKKPVHNYNDYSQTFSCLFDSYYLCHFHMTNRARRGTPDVELDSCVHFGVHDRNCEFGLVHLDGDAKHILMPNDNGRLNLNTKTNTMSWFDNDQLVVCIDRRTNTDTCTFLNVC